MYMQRQNSVNVKEALTFNRKKSTLYHYLVLFIYIYFFVGRYVVIRTHVKCY